jgi:hypothetical protein
MVGGIFTSFLLELLVYPAIYEVWRWNLAVKSKQDSNAVGFGEKSATDLTLKLPSPAPRTIGD